jgi:adenine deaminase
MFTGFVKGFKMRKGAFASSCTWELSGIVVVGTNDEDMAGAVNRVYELQGGAVVYADGEVLAELSMPVGGCVSELPLEELSQKLEILQQKVAELGIVLSDAHFSLTALTTVAIPFFRICETGLMDIREGKVVDLVVP